MAQFIVLEALDGVGKTTLARDLAAHLGGIALDTPGTDLRAVSTRVLDALGQHQTARALFYAASVLSAGERARKLVLEGTTVVMDRYWLSTLSYARARGVDIDLTAIEATVSRPDLTILVGLEEEERQRRLRLRGYTEADRETLEPGFRACVLAEMRTNQRSEGLRPTIEVDVTGLHPAAAVDHLLMCMRLRDVAAQ